MDEFSLRQRARWLVNEAVRGGGLRRPEVCESCWLPDRRLLHGHHEDYSRPLDVIWLCAKCHSRLHAMDRRESADNMMISILKDRREAKHV